MKSSKQPVDRDFFERRLRSYIREYHPRIRQRRRFVRRRSLIAEGIYRSRIAAGRSHGEALARADETLYAGLHFSEYELILTVVTLEAESLPAHCRRILAYDLMPLCEHIFSPCRPFGREVSSALRRRLAEKVSAELRRYAEECGCMILRPSF